jgi:pilus assembly protein FimV
MQMAAFPGTPPISAEAMSKTLSLAPVEQGSGSVDVDFDLGGAVPAASVSAPDFELDGSAGASTVDLGASLDFDIGGGGSTSAADVAGGPATDFSPNGTLIMGASDASGLTAFGDSMDETQPLGDVVRPPDPPSPTIDFDFDLGADAPSGTVESVAVAPAGNAMDFDLSGIDLDLPVSGDMASAGDLPADDAATKLDLAKAYQDMGDKEGAKELLQEVLKEGSDAQKSEAQKLLSAIG